MADRSLTLLELHLHDGVRLSVAGEELIAPDDGGDNGDENGDGDGRRRARTAAALLVLAAAALAVIWRLTEGNLDAARELDGA